MSWLNPTILRGERAALEPLTHAHHDGLVDAVRDGELWKLWYTLVPSPDGMRAEIERRLAQQTAGSMLPFTVRDACTGAIAGMTTYLNVDAVNRRLEIGATWYAAKSQASGLNPDCKLLLLTHAFDVLNCIAVEFRTHFFNQQSRAAIERLGAKLDGILRSHQLMPNGALRDTCVYSIIASEWPAVRSHLQARLRRPRPS